MKARMTGTLIAAALALCGSAALAQLSSDHATVNSYTADDLRKAQAAVTAAGFTPGVVASAQAGNLFMKAMKGGQNYFVTVTPDGHVYAGNPS